MTTSPAGTAFGNVTPTGDGTTPFFHRLFRFRGLTMSDFAADLEILHRIWIAGGLPSSAADGLQGSAATAQPRDAASGHSRKPKGKRGGPPRRPGRLASSRGPRRGTRRMLAEH
jgi:hypothetical protein